ncbi:type II toxin-antitoxin system Phd/YefM family antitoxin [Streptomyces anulatus]|uniref:type II toxin-antitoxin system Phd/YefM family antitoxin n=1 Tax=Streptomyces anulatus TaxID=1892 RepID=UPI00365408EE
MRGSMFTVTSTDVRDRVAELIRRAVQGNAPVGITRYGHIEAVLISKERYDRLTKEQEN